MAVLLIDSRGMDRLTWGEGKVRGGTKTGNRGKKREKGKEKMDGGRGAREKK